MSDEVVLQVDSGTARLVINRPERRNAISWEVISRMRTYLSEVKADPEVRVVVLAGAGDKAFCAGADLGAMAEGAGAYDLHLARGELASLFRDLWELGKPTVARVQGYALAGGFGLALACDFVIASEEAVFGTPETNVGLWPFMITVPLLRSMPPKKALELMMTGRRVDAAEAERIGFVTRVVPGDQLDAAVDELASTLGSKSAAVLRLGRDSFYATLDRPGMDALATLHALLSVSSQLDDAIEGLAAYAEKRDPDWKHR